MIPTLLQGTHHQRLRHHHTKGTRHRHLQGIQDTHHRGHHHTKGTRHHHLQGIQDTHHRGHHVGTKGISLKGIHRPQLRHSTSSVVIMNITNTRIIMMVAPRFYVD
ncbi:hypothetical protein OIU74_015847, partial [Salix koriyanagi]